MVINFCHPAFRPKVATSQVTVDGYEVTNLVSGDQSLNGRGFLTESFVKPPVTIYLCFPLNVEIQRIVLCSQVGAQKSTAFELFTGWLSEAERKTTEFFWEKSCTGNSDDWTVPKDAVLSCVGRGGDANCRFLSFVNRRFKARSPWSELPGFSSRLGGNEDSCSEQDFVVRNVCHISKVNCVSLRVHRWSSVCALKWIEVWGQPLRNIHVRVEHGILRICSQLASTSAERSHSKKEKKHLDILIEKPVPVHELTDTEADVPAEFNDPITHELMLQPTLLPSGQNVDQSTLDRHIAAEARWGREPGDPFTGVTFTSNRKPLPNSALKLRIDKLILETGYTRNRHQIGKSSRSSNNCIGASNISSLVAQHAEMPSRLRNHVQPPSRSPQMKNTHLSGFNATQPSSTKMESKSERISLNSEPYLRTKLRNRKTSESFQREFIDLTGSDSDPTEDNVATAVGPISVRKRARLSSPGSGERPPHTNDNTSRVSGTTKQSHAAALSDSLQSALSRTLSSLPSFVTNSNPAGPEKENPHSSTSFANTTLGSNRLINQALVASSSGLRCAQCKKDNDIMRMYQLECEHVVCRVCLVATAARTVTCTICARPSKKEKVVKAQR